MRVFLDTNVIVSAVATRGLCADVLREVIQSHELVVSEELFLELRRVLPEKLGVPASLTTEVIIFLQSGSIRADAHPQIKRPISDPIDKALISAAVNARADVFVTGDGELLGSFPGGVPEVISPRMFWERLRSKR